MLLEDKPIRSESELLTFMVLGLGQIQLTLLQMEFLIEWFQLILSKTQAMQLTS